jgi:hypothetical protein
MTNQERFDKVFKNNKHFSLKGEYIYHDSLEIPVCCIPNREMPLFLDCLDKMHLGRISLEKLDSLESVFGMATSHLCYGGRWEDAETVMKTNEYFQSSYMEKATFKEKVFIYKYLQSMVEDVKAGVFTDDEGCSYNSISFREIA